MTRADAHSLIPVLEQSLARHFGVSRSIIDLLQSPSPYRSSFQAEDVDLRFTDGTTMKLFLKRVGREALLKEARNAKPPFLYNPMREISTYQAILQSNELGTAVFYGSFVDQGTERYWLFLEKVPGTVLCEVGDFKIWEEVARWLGGMHTRLAGAVELHGRSGHLMRYDGDFYRRWLARAREYTKLDGRHLRQRNRVMEWLDQHYDRIIDRLLALPPVFIHGEFYPSNVLVQKTPRGTRICPVDWEMSAVGPGLMDLAALIAGRWSEEQRTALALAYHSVFNAEGSRNETREEFLAALECCRLHLAVQSLGWSSEWSPPPEHEHNWLHEALWLIEKISL